MLMRLAAAGCGAAVSASGICAFYVGATETTDPVAASSLVAAGLLAVVIGAGLAAFSLTADVEIK